MSGLARICKMYGGMTVKVDGKTVKYVYDYHRDIAVHEKEMTEEQKKLSERAKWSNIKI